MAISVDSGSTSPIDLMRDLLLRAEKRVVALAEGGGAPELYAWLDEIAASWPVLIASGADLRGEKARWQSLQGEVSARAGAVLRAWQSAGGLPAARLAANPNADNWWWWLDQQTAAQRSRRRKRAALIAAIAVVVLIVASQALRVLLPVDPVVRDVYRLRESARRALEAGDTAGALANYREAVGRSPNDPQLLVMEGVLAEQLGELDAAASAFDAARAASPSDAAYHVERGFAYLEAFVPEKALAEGLQAVEASPEDGRAWMLVGAARERSGDLAGALDAYTQASTVAADSDPEITAVARMRMAGIMQSMQEVAPITPMP